MNRLLVAALVLVLLGVGVGSAIGQGTGGTVGPAATGVKSFEIKFGGVGCGLSSVNKCFRRKVRIGHVFAGNGTISLDGKKVGSVVPSDVAAKKLKKNTSIDTFTATIYYPNGVDTLTVAGASRGDEKSLAYAVVGGTGIYAGARGTARDVKISDSGVTVEVTFIP